MIGRGLRAPALVIADGAPGIWKAVRELWPTALEQRCTVHALRNVTGKLPERHHQEVKARWWKAFDEARSPGEASRMLQSIIADHKTAYPSAMAVIEADLSTLITHLQFSLRAPQAKPHNESPRADIRRGPTSHQGHRPVPRRDIRPPTDLSRAGTLITWLARREDEPTNRLRDRAPTPPTPRHHDRSTSHDETPRR